MNISNNKNIYVIRSKNLLLRTNADELMERLEKFHSPETFVDFSNIHAISRAFVHQYLINKQKSKKTIEEINVSPHVKKMFELVEKTIKS